MKMKVMEICQLLHSLEIQENQHHQNGMDKMYYLQNSNALRRGLFIVVVLLRPYIYYYNDRK